jgi:hypothetical protein
MFITKNADRLLTFLPYAGITKPLRSGPKTDDSTMILIVPGLTVSRQSFLPLVLRTFAFVVVIQRNLKIDSSARNSKIRGGSHGVPRLRRPLFGITFKKSALQVLLLAACCAFVRPGNATTVRTLDLPDLVQRADIIADVTVTAVQSYWASPAGGNAIHTRVTFSLNSAPLKGQVTSPFTLDFLGGTAGNRTMAVSGMPQPHVGDRLILFSYSPEKSSVSPVIGFDQGALRVIRDQTSSVDRVYRWWGQPVNESQLFTSRVPVPAASSNADLLRSANSVDEFLQRVSKLIHQ